MGLTAKKICGVCGKKISTMAALYTTCEMRDDSYLCHDCRGKCSAFLRGSQITSWIKQDALDHIHRLETMKLQIQREFVETAAIISQSTNEKLLCIDAQHGWFYTPQNPEIFTLDQIQSWQINIACSTEDSGLHLAKYKPARAELPVPGRLEALTGMDFVIKLRNHPYADEMSVCICGKNTAFFKSYGKYLDQAYQTADDCYRLMEQYAGRQTEAICAPASGQTEQQPKMHKKVRNTSGTITFYD